MNFDVGATNAGEEMGVGCVVAFDAEDDGSKQEYGTRGEGAVLVEEADIVAEEVGFCLVRLEHHPGG